jgi:hypothetical protein
MIKVVNREFADRASQDGNVDKNLELHCTASLPCGRLVYTMDGVPLDI